MCAMDRVYTHMLIQTPSTPAPGTWASVSVRAGEYIPMEVGVEAGKEEEDEFVPRIVSRWKASHITEIMVEEEEEKKEAHTTEQNAFEAVEAV